jgi:hypothetical protein
MCQIAFFYRHTQLDDYSDWKELRRKDGVEWGEVCEELELVGKYSICAKHPRRGQPLKHVSCASDPLVLTLNVLVNGSYLNWPL